VKTYKNLIESRHESSAVLQINRPDKLNALNRETIAELHEAFSNLDADQSVRSIILRGAGLKAFVAGADISEFAHFNDREGRELASEGQDRLFNFVEQLQTPVIAAINGFALGGGLELAMSCHIRVASHNAKMGLPEVTLGVIPGYGGTQRLPQLIGKGRALEMILTAAMVDAERALEIGLVNHVIAIEELDAFCLKMAARIAQNGPLALANAIKAVNAGFSSSKIGYQAEIEAFGACFATADFKEGTTAFLEKRKPIFEGK
jgi:enoyl-CoA hydratase